MTTMLPVAKQKVYLGLGSNLDNPCEQLSKAIDAILQLPDTSHLQTSAYYQSPPLPGSEPPDYVNCVLAIETLLNPERLLQQLQNIETDMGRPVNRKHWAARHIDIDILLYDNLSLSTKTLTIPHAGLTERAFVVVPLLTISPNLRLPTGEYLAIYRDKFNQHDLLEIKNHE